MMNDPYDGGGTPKYKYASSIYEALCDLVQAEEMDILSQLFGDVSWEGQDYYYTDNGHGLKERFEKLSDFGDKLWLLDLAVYQMDKGEIHGIVYEALLNPDLAKRLGFKKIFINAMLQGDAEQYAEIAEKFAEELSDCNRFGFWEMITSFHTVMQPRGYWMEYTRTAYNDLCNALITKLENLKLQEEKQLIIECRALLTSYDDFMFGLRSNQHLYEQLERQYQGKMVLLQEKYEEKTRQVLDVAQRQGIVLVAELPTGLTTGVDAGGFDDGTTNVAQR